MRILRNPTRTGPCVLVLGMFDGVHQGHQALLRTGKQLANRHHLPLNVCTFEPHPLAVLFPDRTPPRLTTQTQRARLMQACGVDTLCVTGFTRAYAGILPEQFVQQMAAIYQPAYVVCGFNYTFGDRGRGNAETLRLLQEQYHYELITVPAVELEGDVVSSTRIRKLLAAGELDQANRLLGHCYSVCGRVIHGKHIGRTLGFPTANVAVRASQALPAYGVYTCLMTVRGDERTHHAVVNVGRHPTLPEGTVTVEAHLLDETMQLYGAQVRLDFLSFRRAERPFASVSELRDQIARDAEDARTFFGRAE